MILTIDNLRAGIRWRSGRRNWSSLYNEGYYDIYEKRADGLTHEWWDVTVNRLARWTAFRGQKPPNTKVAICRRGRRILNLVSEAYLRLRSGAEEPSISKLDWEDIGPIFDLVASIKPRSFVFASKAGHFILPKVFIVVDNLATEVFDYEFYWRGMRDEWMRFEEKEEAIEILRASIRSNQPVHYDFPFETRIMEVSHTGYKHRHDKS